MNTAFRNYPLYCIATAVLLNVMVCTAANAAPEKAIRIGALMPLSGDFASYGTAIQQGLQLAVEDVRNTPGFDYEIQAMIQDACLPAETVNALHTFEVQGGIDALVGNYCVIGLSPIASRLKEKRILTFQSSLLPDALLSDSPYLFSTLGRIQTEAYLLAEYAYLTRDNRTASVLNLQTQWGEEYAAKFKERFEQLGGKVLSIDENPIGDANFRSRLAKVRSLKPDTILFAHLSGALGSLMKQAHQLGIDSQFMMVSEGEDPTTVKNGGGALSGVHYFSPDPEATDPRTANFRSKFAERYGELPSLLSMNAYDSTRIAIQTLTSCHLDRECARQRAGTLKNYAGVSGTLSFTNSHAAEKKFVLKTINAEGNFVRVE